MSIAQIIPGIMCTLVGAPFLLIGIMVSRKTDYSKWKKATGTVLSVRTSSFDRESNQTQSIPAELEIEFTDDEGRVRRGRSNCIGDRTDIAAVREKYPVGSEVSLVYNDNSKSVNGKAFKSIFGAEPSVPVHVFDDEFPGSKGLAGLPLIIFGGIFIAIGILTSAGVFKL